MLEGLEIKEVSISELFEPLRIDAETYQPFYMDIEDAVTSLDYVELGSLSKVFKKGIFDIKSDTYTDSGIPFVRISNLKNMSIDESDIIYIPESENSKNLNTFLSKGDLILSKTAVPAASIVQLDHCNTSQDTVAIKLHEDADVKSSFLVTFLNSKYGFFQMKRWFTGNVQMHLNLTDAKGLYVPILSKNFQSTIDKIIWKSFELKDNYKQIYFEAEQLLLEEVGLNNFQPSQESTNIKSFDESFGLHGRLDAEFYQKKYDQLYENIQNYGSYERIKDIRTDNYRGVQPVYTEDGMLDIVNSKHILENTLDYDNFEKTDIKYWEIKKKARISKFDILTYTTGANIGRTQVYLSENKALASNHVNILRLKEEYDAVYVGFVMNSFIGRMQTQQLSAGSAQAELYPKDVDNFLIPIVKPSIQQKISDFIESFIAMKKRSEHLLDVSKRAVEIAIEKSEDEALFFIEEQVN